MSQLIVGKTLSQISDQEEALDVLIRKNDFLQDDLVKLVPGTKFVSSSNATLLESIVEKGPSAVVKDERSNINSSNESKTDSVDLKGYLPYNNEIIYKIDQDTTLSTGSSKHSLDCSGSTQWGLNNFKVLNKDRNDVGIRIFNDREVENQYDTFDENKTDALDYKASMPTNEYDSTLSKQNVVMQKGLFPENLQPTMFKVTSEQAKLNISDWDDVNSLDVSEINWNNILYKNPKNLSEALELKNEEGRNTNDLFTESNALTLENNFLNTSSLKVRLHVDKAQPTLDNDQLLSLDEDDGVQFPDVNLNSLQHYPDKVNLKLLRPKNEVVYRQEGFTDASAAPLVSPYFNVDLNVTELLPNSAANLTNTDMVLSIDNHSEGTRMTYAANSGSSHTSLLSSSVRYPEMNENLKTTENVSFRMHKKHNFFAKCVESLNNLAGNSIASLSNIRADDKDYVVKLNKGQGLKSDYFFVPYDNPNDSLPNEGTQKIYSLSQSNSININKALINASVSALDPSYQIIFNHQRYEISSGMLSLDNSLSSSSVSMVNVMNFPTNLIEYKKESMYDDNGNVVKVCDWTDTLEDDFRYTLCMNVGNKSLNQDLISIKAISNKEPDSQGIILYRRGLPQQSATVTTTTNDDQNGVRNVRHNIQINKNYIPGLVFSSENNLFEFNIDLQYELRDGKYQIINSSQVDSTGHQVLATFKVNCYSNTAYILNSRDGYAVSNRVSVDFRELHNVKLNFRLSGSDYVNLFLDSHNDSVRADVYRLILRPDQIWSLSATVKNMSGKELDYPDFSSEGDLLQVVKNVHQNSLSQTSFSVYDNHSLNVSQGSSAHKLFDLQLNKSLSNIESEFFVIVRHHSVWILSNVQGQAVNESNLVQTFHRSNSHTFLISNGIDVTLNTSSKVIYNWSSNTTITGTELQQFLFDHNLDLGSRITFSLKKDRYNVIDYGSNVLVVPSDIPSNKVLVDSNHYNTLVNPSDIRLTPISCNIYRGFGNLTKVLVKRNQVKLIYNTLDSVTDISGERFVLPLAYNEDCRQFPSLVSGSNPLSFMSKFDLYLDWNPLANGVVDSINESNLVINRPRVVMSIFDENSLIRGKVSSESYKKLSFADFNWAGSSSTSLEPFTTMFYLKNMRQNETCGLEIDASSSNIFISLQQGIRDPDYKVTRKDDDGKDVRIRLKNDDVGVEISGVSFKLANVAKRFRSIKATSYAMIPRTMAHITMMKNEGNVVSKHSQFRVIDNVANKQLSFNMPDSNNVFKMLVNSSSTSSENYYGYDLKYNILNNRATVAVEDRLGNFSEVISNSRLNNDSTVFNLQIPDPSGAYKSSTETFASLSFNNGLMRPTTLKNSSNEWLYSDASAGFVPRLSGHNHNGLGDYAGMHMGTDRVLVANMWSLSQKDEIDNGKLVTNYYLTNRSDSMTWNDGQLAVANGGSQGFVKTVLNGVEGYSWKPEIDSGSFVKYKLTGESRDLEKLHNKYMMGAVNSWPELLDASAQDIMASQVNGAQPSDDDCNLAVFIPASSVSELRERVKCLFGPSNTGRKSNGSAGSKQYKILLADLLQSQDHNGSVVYRIDPSGKVHQNLNLLPLL